MIEIGIQYPYLEDEGECKAYVKDSRKPDSMRYENYCCFVFNLLEMIYDFCDGDRGKISEILYVEEIILTHARWWRADKKNIAGYNQDFLLFVNGVINEAERS